jgi:hypothetical protein
MRQSEIGAILLSVEGRPPSSRSYRPTSHRVIAIIMTIKLPNSHYRLQLMAAPYRWVKDVQMADGLLLKPQGRGVEGGRSKRVRSGNPAGRLTRRTLQPEGEILLQICCRCSESPSSAQLFVAAGGSSRRRPGVYRAIGPACIRYSGSRAVSVIDRPCELSMQRFRKCMVLSRYMLPIYSGRVCTNVNSVRQRQRLTDT